MIRPSLAIDGGEAWKAALLLLAPLKAALSEDELLAVFDLIKTSPSGKLDAAISSMERPNAMITAAVMTTRFSASPGMPEASEMVSLAARYADAGIIMPPETGMWSKAWYIAMWPSALESVFDTVEDGLSSLALQKSTEFDPAAPPSPLNGPQSAGYREGLTKVLNNNIVAYTSAAPDTE